MVQLPSDAPLPRLGQASFAVALVGSPVASRIASQAHPVERDGCLTKEKFPYLVVLETSNSDLHNAQSLPYARDYAEH